MRKVTITHPIRQLFMVIAGFVAVSLLLDFDGLASWANRLEIGPLRTLAVPVTEAIERSLQPLGLGAIRAHALKTLARAGWSDDAAGLAGANPQPAAPGAGNPGQNAATLSGNPSGRSNFLPPADYHHSAGAETPLAAEAPRSIALPPLAPIAPGKPRVVALTGDSMMAVGLSATLLRQAAGDSNLRMVKLFRSGTGLARPEVFNWMEEYPAMLGAEKPDVVIVAIGANDGQGFVVDGKVLACGTEPWRMVYQQRLASFLAMVSAGGAQVIWVGLPPMRAPTYNEKIAEINRIAYTVVSQNPQAAWFSPISFVGDETGKFREFELLSNGRSLRLRSSDGIHFSDDGAGRLTTVLMKWLDPPKSAEGTSVAEAPRRNR